MTTYECYECPNRHCRAANSQEDRPVAPPPLDGPAGQLLFNF
ncbi:hypothetical protein [uncultured Victivallis sp.]|nr:hypothetical protein [uncultured Victivallis sp.]